MRAILMYHSIDDSGSPISVTLDVFERHMQALGEARVPVVALSELLLRGDGEHAVAITFDDAFQNFADLAWPRMRERGYACTMYAVSGRVGRTNDWETGPVSSVPELPLMDWETLGRLKDEGLEIGGHSRTHRSLKSLPMHVVEDEIAGDKEAIGERLGRVPRSFAYPYGDVDPAAARVAERHYDNACTTDMALLEGSSSRHVLPRLDAIYFRDNDLLSEFGTRPFVRYIKRRAVLRRIRSRARAWFGRFSRSERS